MSKKKLQWTLTRITSHPQTPQQREAFLQREAVRLQRIESARRSQDALTAAITENEHQRRAESTAIELANKRAASAAARAARVARRAAARSKLNQPHQIPEPQPISQIPPIPTRSTELQPISAIHPHIQQISQSNNAVQQNTWILCWTALLD